MDGNMNAKLLRSISVQLSGEMWDAWEFYSYDGLIDQVTFCERLPGTRLKTVPFDQIQAVLDHEVVPFRMVWGAIMQINWSGDAEHLQHPRPKPDFSRIPTKLFNEDGIVPHWLDILESKRDED